MKREPKDAHISFRVPRWVKDAARELFEKDPRKFSSASDYNAQLFAEAVMARLPAREVAKRQREAARAAERRVG